MSPTNTLRYVIPARREFSVFLQRLWIPTGAGMTTYLLALLLLCPLVRATSAQQTEDSVRVAAESMLAPNPAALLANYEVILASDSFNLDALAGASTASVELGEAEPDEKRRAAHYSKALNYARAAVRAHPNSATSRFQLSLALGVSAVNVGAGERIKNAKEIRENAMEALRLEPNHPGALHVMGMWHAELVRISGLKRLVARTFLGGGFMAEANWEDATRFMERSVALEPNNLRHHLDLARIYRDRGMTGKAQACFRRVVDGQPVAFNDHTYITVARRELARM